MTPATGLPPVRAAKATAYGLHGEVTTVHTFSTAEPYWIIEVYQQGSSYRDPALSTAEVLVGLCAGLLRLDGEAP